MLISILFAIIILSTIFGSPFWITHLVVSLNRRQVNKNWLRDAIKTASDKGEISHASLGLLGLAGFSFGLLTWYLFNDFNFIALQTALVFTAVVAFIALFAGLSRRKISTDVFAVWAASLTCFALLAIRASDSLKALNIHVGGTLLVLGLGAMGRKSFASLTVSDHARSILAPLSWTLGLWGYVRSFAVIGKVPKIKLSITGLSSETKKGIAIALPLLLIFTMLFASADDNFADLLPSLSLPDWNVSDRLAGIVLTTLFVGIFMIGLTFYLLTLHNTDQASSTPTIDDPSAESVVAKRTITIVLASVIGLFAIFCLTQIPVIFSSDAIGSDADLSNNTRRGFTQLVFASIIVFLLLIWVEHRSRIKDALIRNLSISLVGLTYVVLISAFVRLLATENEYGFTLTRFFGHSYMILMALWLAMLLVKMVGGFSWRHFGHAVLASVFCYTLVMNLINPEAMIAKINIDRYEQRDIDTNYLGRLSTDAWPAIEDGIADGKITESEAAAITERFCVINMPSLQNSDSWRNWNASFNYYRSQTKDLKSFKDCNQTNR